MIFVLEYLVIAIVIYIVTKKLAIKMGFGRKDEVNYLCLGISIFWMVLADVLVFVFFGWVFVTVFEFFRKSKSKQVVC